MDWLISNAWAQQAGAQEPSIWIQMAPLVLIMVVFYFLLIRPQQKRMSDHRKMVDAIGTGDEVVTNGGLLGRITKLDDSFMILELTRGVEVKIQRHAITSVLPKGTIKEIVSDKKSSKKDKVRPLRSKVSVSPMVSMLLNSSAMKVKIIIAKSTEARQINKVSTTNCSMIWRR